MNPVIGFAFDIQNKKKRNKTIKLFNAFAMIR